MSAVGAPSHPTMCELAPALVCLHTWIPMMRIGGTGGPGFGWHCATRGPVWGGFAWAGDWLQFWILLARFHCQSLLLRSREGCKCPCRPLPPSLPNVHSDEEHVCACVPTMCVWCVCSTCVQTWTNTYEIRLGVIKMALILDALRHEKPTWPRSVAA